MPLQLGSPIDPFLEVTMFRFLLTFLLATFVALAAYAATKKVIYFTSGSVPTAGELVQINALKAKTVPEYSLSVRNSKKTINHKEATDYVYGAIPPAYRDGGIDSGSLLYPAYTP